MTDKVQTRTIGSANHTLPSKPYRIKLQYGSLSWKSGPNKYRGADKSLARPTSRCILFDG